MRHLIFATANIRMDDLTSHLYFNTISFGLIHIEDVRFQQCENHVGLKFFLFMTLVLLKTQIYNHI